MGVRHLKQTQFLLLVPTIKTIITIGHTHLHLIMIDMETVAVPCDGRVECQDAADESWLCTDQYILIYVVLGKVNKDKYQ